MKALIRVVNTFFMIVLAPMLLISCNNKTGSDIIPIYRDTMENNESTVDVKEQIKKVIEGRYIVNDPFFQIIELSTDEQPFGQYYYKIFSSRKVFAEDIVAIEPKINCVGDGIIKSLLAFGSNGFALKYFDAWGDRSTAELFLYSLPAEYVQIRKDDTTEVLVAYFDIDTHHRFGENILVVKDVFDEQGFYIELAKGFVAPSCNKLLFLNENELYLDYDVLADGYSHEDVVADNNFKTENIREIVSFR